jgi:hypothetical protein
MKPQKLLRSNEWYERHRDHYDDLDVAGFWQDITWGEYLRLKFSRIWWKVRINW